MPKRIVLTGAVCALLAAPLPLAAASAESIEAFYKDNNISLIIGYNPGGTYDLYARLAAKYMPRYIPGHPTIISKNLPGVGSLKAANYLFKQAARDGSVLGVVSQGTALQQVLKHRAVRYDARRFNWIGRLTSAVECTVVWHTVPVKTIADARKRVTVIGATSPRSSTDTNHKLMNALVGTKFKIVLGYKGTTGSLLAMERGEVEGSLAVVQNLLVQKPQWIKDKKISMLVQYSTKRHPAFPNVPTMVELGTNAEDKEILSLYGGTAEVGRSIMTPPDVPADRLAALRGAFRAMLKDKDFLAEMKRRKMELDPMPGEELQKLVASTFTISPKAAARAAEARN